MFNMSNNLEVFLNWLNDVMREKNITQADIARTKHVKPSSVSMLFSQQVKSVGIDMCKAISAATGIPLEAVYRKAGLLPPVTLPESQQEYVRSLIESLDQDLRENAIDYLGMLQSKQKSRQTSKPKTQPKHV